MTTRTKPVCGIVWKGGTALFLARVVGWDGATVKQADIESISYTVSLVAADDRNAASAVADHEAVELAAADVWHDTLVTTDSRWTLDDVGYNLAHLLDTTTADAFAVAGRQYLVTYRVKLNDLPAIMVVFQIDCRLS
jgi:hypothetical protein